MAMLLLLINACVCPNYFVVQNKLISIYLSTVEIIFEYDLFVLMMDLATSETFRNFIVLNKALLFLIKIK